MINLIHPSMWIRTVPWPEDFHLPKFQSHRGYHKKMGVIENTRDAFHESKRLGFSMVECDVHLTKDQVPVIFHDKNLERVYGIKKEVSELSYSELKASTNILSLAEMLQDPEIPDFINIELKSETVFGEALEARVSELINGLSYTKKIIFSSFNPISLFKIQKLQPNISRALLVSNDHGTWKDFILRNMLLAPLLKIQCLNLEDVMVTEDSMKIWNQKKIPIAVWTVDSSKRIKQLREFGVASIITDLDDQVF